MEQTAALAELATFLVEAKRGTYAASGDMGRVLSPFAGARQLEYRRGRWLYRDLYYGGIRFAGLETVSIDEVPVWSMVYAGGLAPDTSASPGEVYAVLQRALLMVTRERPFRGPERCDWQEWRYASWVDGDLRRFEGRESIRRGAVVVYELAFAGGEIILGEA